MIDLNSTDDEVMEFMIGNDTTEAQKVTAQTNSNPHTGIEPNSFNGFELVEPPEYVEESGHESRTTGQTGQKRTYSHYSFADACKTANAISYIIAGHVQEKGLHMTFGEPASGKTFHVIDMACAIACDEISSWQGKSLKHGQVIYFAGEASQGVKLRLLGQAIRRGINPENVKLEVIDEVFSLDDESDMDHQLETTIENIKAFAPNPVYIVIDTLHAFMAGDENNAGDTRKFLTVCRKLVKEYGCAVELIHHVGVSQDAKGRARGSSSWLGAMDIMTLVQSTGINGDGITYKVIQKKHKDGKKQKDLVFRATEVILTDILDENGEPVTTLVPELDEVGTRENLAKADEKKNPQPERQKLSKGQNFALQTYIEAAKESGRIVVDAKTYGETVWVNMEDWKEIYLSKDTHEKAETRERNFRTYRNQLTNDRKTLTLRREN